MFSNRKKFVQSEPFNPEEASRKIAQNSQDIQTWGAEIINARNALIVAETEYLQAKKESQIERLGQMSVTMAQNYIEIDTCDQRIALKQAENELKNMMENKDIVVEVNNNLKQQIRLWELERNDLRFTQ